jgi:hypothetical protein
MFEPLHDPEKLDAAGLDEDGVICRPNGADPAPRHGNRCPSPSRRSRICSVSPLRSF